MKENDVVIIGGGIGGLTVAYGALYNGLSVTIVDKHQVLGGESLRHTCIPTKTLSHAAKIAHMVKNADKFGIDAYLLSVDLGKVNDHIDAVRAKIQTEENYGWFAQMGGQIIHGAAKFFDPSTILVNNTKIRGKKFVIATGSNTAIPKIPGLAATGYLTNETIFQKLSLPQKIVVLGAGGTGIEFAQAFTRLGSTVVVIDKNEQILSNEDSELTWHLRDTLEKEGIKFHLSTKVQEICTQNNKKVLVCNNKQGDKFVVESNDVFIATGRTPNAAGLNLEIAGVHYDERGIFVDKLLRTSNKKIYAVGDVINSLHKYTNVAEYQANSVVNHMLFKVPFCSQNKIIPRVVSTDPELAQVGLTELAAAKRKFAKIEVLRLDLKGNDRAMTCGATTGKLKLLVSNNRIVGASILGPHAGELICELTLAINMRARLEDIAMTLHPYPTFAEMNRKIINQHANKKGMSYYMKKIISFAQRAFA